MKYTLYQVQLESKDATYCFEISTDEFDAVDLAEIWLAVNLDVYGPFHVGGYHSIGYTDTKDISYLNPLTRQREVTILT